MRNEMIEKGFCVHGNVPGACALCQQKNRLDSLRMSWSEITDPADSRFKEWLRSQYNNYHLRHPEEGTFGGVDYSYIHPMRALKEALSTLGKEQGVSAEILYSLFEKLAKLKERLFDSLPTRSDVSTEDEKKELQLLEEEVYCGKTLEDVLDTEISEEQGKRFDAHGIAKGNQLQVLRKVLYDGLDTKKPLHTAPLKCDISVGLALGSNRGGAYAHGGFMLVGGQDAILQDGVRLVLINWQYREAAVTLAREFPQYVFATPEGVKAALEYLGKKT